MEPLYFLLMSPIYLRLTVIQHAPWQRFQTGGSLGDIR